MSLRPLTTVDRGSDWRVRLPFWDRATFQAITVPPAGLTADAVLSLALHREGGCFDHRGWLRDYGLFPWLFCRRDRAPAFSALSNDGTGRLQFEAGRTAALVAIPQSAVATIEPGVYLASLAVANLDGSILDLGSDLVTVTGHALPVPHAGP